MLKTKATYVPPQLTSVCFKAEKGYATSNVIMEELNLIMIDDNLVINPNSQTYVEVYSTANDWHEGSNHFWD